ncbi:dTDP-4-dehydrorhamnose reductase [Pseudoalteromonas sp. YIC-656]|uniref:dTDP-4-dehydrorhamnose reductase n=1 Tax=Pseudoalteromonas pernae TaxID=3118054 RepID=UPI003241FFC0
MIVVIGSSGQLAWEIKRLAPQSVCLGRDKINLEDVASLEQQLQEYRPKAIINASAYTAVDKAESDLDAAYQLNAKAVAHLAKYCEENACHLVHVSTDYVFPGDKGSPYLPDEPLKPIGVYGQSKAEGEKYVQSLQTKGCIIRTSWVYSEHGNNFVKSMLHLMSNRDSLGIVSDQIGSPTWAKTLAKACIEAANNEYSGVYHWTDLGVASWYDFAQAVYEFGCELDLLQGGVDINPIRTEDYPTPAKRPKYSVLEKHDTQKEFKETQMQYWRKQLKQMLIELKENELNAGK